MKENNNYIYVPELQNLAIADLMACASGLPDTLYEISENYVEKIYTSLLNALQSGEIDYFYYDNSNEKPNNYMQYIFTRSIKKIGKIQCSCIWFKNDDIIPMSDGQYLDYKDLQRYNENAVNVRLYYGSL